MGQHPATPRSTRADLERTELNARIEPAVPTHIPFDTDASISAPPQPDATSLSAARDEYLQDLHQRKLYSKPSLFMAPFKKRQEKSDRGSAVIVRSTVTYESVEDWVEQQGINTATNEPHPELRARSSSNSFKNKIKRVFRRSSNSMSALPIQQLDATREHFGDAFTHVPAAASTTDGLPAPAPAEEVVQAIEFCSSSSYNKPSEARPRSYSAGSALSEGRASDSKSRVTSWSNSSIANTVVIREPAKRLTAIPENTAPSPPKLGGLPQIKDCDIFKNPMRRRRGSSEDEPAPVDSQRVYSALMKRIDEAGLNAANRRPEAEGAATCAVPSAIGTLPSQSRRSSLSSGISRLTKATIRTVTKDARGPERAETANVATESIGYPSAGQDYDESLAKHSGTSDNSKNPLEAKKGRGTSLNRAAKAIPPSSLQIAKRLDKVDDAWNGPLDEGTPPFSQPRTTPHAMPREDTFANFRRRSPAGDKALPSTPNARELTAQPGERSDLREQIASDILNVVSPSIYSRNTNGQSPGSNDSSISLVCGENDGTGTAVIITSHPVKSYALGSGRVHTRIQSGKSSKEWKAWLSKEVSELEVQSRQDITIGNEFFRKRSAHHSEHATDQGGRASSSQDAQNDSVPPKAATSSSPPESARRPVLEERPSNLMNDRFPMLPTRPRARREPTPPKDVEAASVTTLEPSKACIPGKLLRPKLEDRSSSQMNDRFPMLFTGRKSSKENTKENSKPSRQTSLETEAQPTKPVAKENMSNTLQVPLRRDLFKARSMQAMHRTPSPRSQTSLSQYTITGEAHRLEAVRSPTPNLLRKRADRTVFRAKSALDMRSQTPTHVTPPQSRRKPIAGPMMEGDTLKMMLKGPYSPKSPTLRANKENSPAVTSEVTPSGGHRMADVFLSNRQNVVLAEDARESPVFL